MPEPRERVLVVAGSARALAESAARAGYVVTAIDAFGDLDTAQVAPRSLAARDLAVRYAPLAIAHLAGGLDADALVYGGGWENHPRAIRVAATGRRLWGNPPAVLRRVRDPLRLADTVRRSGFPAPIALAGASSADAARAWLMKPRRSAGGRGITRWSPARRLAAGAFLQEHIEGVPASIAFVATTDRRVLPLALSRQLVGEGAFGAAGFQYCGSILSADDDPQLPFAPALRSGAIALAEAVTAAFGLVGVNGIDFIAREGVPWIIEVNPRYSASMELVERAGGLSIFTLHARACSDRSGGLAPAPPPPLDGAIGKAILYARCATRIGDSRSWLAEDDLRDIPRPGERIERGQPVCTIFARARDAAACHAALVRRADALYEELERIARPAA